MVTVANESWVGRKVKCIDNGWDDILIEGCIYRVTSETPEYISLEIAHCGFPRRRFELLPQEHPQEDAFEVPSPAETKASDAVNRPSHYARFKIEPIHFIMENNLEFWQGNVIKYTLRWDGKDGLQDLKKARRYLDMQIKKMEGDAKWSE
jgi:hypothetical protein